MDNSIPPQARHYLGERPRRLFWRRIDFNGGYKYQDDALVDLSKVQGECWLWRGEVGGRKKNYGFFESLGTKEAAHRVAFKDFGFGIATGLQLDHLCRVNVCVNPAHLEPVTNRENTLRGALASHGLCRNGHDLTLPGSQYKRSDAVRCKACSLISLRRSRDKKKAQHSHLHSDASARDAT